MVCESSTHNNSNSNNNNDDDDDNDNDNNDDDDDDDGDNLIHNSKPTYQGPLLIVIVFGLREISGV